MIRLCSTRLVWFCRLNLLLAAWLTALPAGAAIFTVGGAGCTHADLFSALVTAINNPGPDEIRLLANTSHLGQFLVNSGDGLSIRGGFPSCAATLPTGRSTILGSNSNRAMSTIVNSPMTLERLDLTSGSVTGNGGGLFAQGTARLDLVNVFVLGNSATDKGGNVYVSGSPGLEVRFLSGSIVSAGEAPNGGGVACTGDGGVFLLGDSSIINNIATSNGGGVWLGGGCEMFSSAGGTVGGIRSNASGNHGGGVYVEGGAEFNTGLSTLGLAVIEGNSANNGGGGVFATDLTSRLRLYSARTSLNEADGAGGAFFADNEAQVMVGRPVSNPDPCPDVVRCSQLFSNSAAVGGAFYSDDDAQVTIHGTHIEQNVASLFNSVGSIRGGSNVIIDSTVIAANNGARPFLITDAGSSLTLGNVTMVGNNNVGTGVLEVGSVSVGPIRVLSSVFVQQGRLFVPGFPASITPQVDCVVSSIIDLFIGMPSGTVVREFTVGEPSLANPSAGNYMLTGDSLAIDFCDTTEWNWSPQDLKWQARDVDDPAQPNNIGTRDLGADEYQAMFVDGFESGDTSRWTTVVQ